MTLTSQASNIPLHTWRKGSGFHGNAHLRSSQFTHPAPLLLYPRHASLPVLIRASQKEYLDMQGFLPSFCWQNSHGYLGGQQGLWGYASIFQTQWTIRWWKLQRAWEDGDILTVSNSNFQYCITIRKHNGLKIQAKVPLIQQNSKGRCKHCFDHLKECLFTHTSEQIPPAICSLIPVPKFPFPLSCISRVF